LDKPVKLCKDCKHWRPNSLSKHNGNPRDNFDKCAHPKCVIVTDRKEVIRGSQLQTNKQMYCSIAREYRHCGTEAKYFEPSIDESPRLSWWKMFFKDLGKGMF